MRRSGQDGPFTSAGVTLRLIPFLPKIAVLLWLPPGSGRWRDVAGVSIALSVGPWVVDRARACEGRLMCNGWKTVVVALGLLAGSVHAEDGRWRPPPLRPGDVSRAL